MILQRLTIARFRQYREKQTIFFAGSEDGGTRNVTVIFGENGRGKTGLYRAMVFALFGEVRLSQDEDASSDEIRLVNATALKEARDREPVDATVELEYEHEGTVYNLFRKRVAIRQGERVREEAGGVMLRMLMPDGNTRVVEDEVEVSRVVESILSPRVKDFYLFDGERMDRLTRAGLVQRKEVAKGIRSLLNIDALENAANAMEKVTARFTADLNKASSVEYARVLKQVEDCQAQLTEAKEGTDLIDSELDLANDEIRRLDTALESFKEIRDLVLRRKDLQSMIVQRERERQTVALTLGNLLPRASILLLRPTIDSVYRSIESRRLKGELPAEIRRDLIDRVLRDDLCICGRTIRADEAALKSIEAWKEKTTEEAVEDAALRLWQQLAGITRHVEDYDNEVTGQLQLYGSAMNDIAEFERQLEEIGEKIGHSERQDATELEGHRNIADIKRVTLLADRRNLEASITALRLTLDQLNSKKDEEEAKLAKQDEFTARVVLSRKVTEALKSVYGRFTKEIRERLATLATEALRNLLDEAGQATISRVRVKDDYSLEVFNKFGEPWLAEISAGQRQVLSIAFIAALAEAASNGSLLEMPLFMDTPFGRLSAHHRENLMRLVPQKTAQWILLATDTEFRADEADTLEDTGSWGRLYFLRQDKEGDTFIEERNPTKFSFQSYIGTGGKA